MEIGRWIINQLVGLRPRGWNKVRRENIIQLLDLKSAFWLEVK
jgi:hypothetical protein